MASTGTFDADADADADGGVGVGGVVVRVGLLERLGGPARVVVVSAPAGSGKSVLLRSWVSQAGLIGRVGWVTAGSDERDRFWLAVLNALRGTTPGSGLVQRLTAAPDLDGWAVVERLLKDLASLRESVWLVVDDVHDLSSDEMFRQLELLVLRAPPELRFVFAARRDVRLGLRRLRLEGQLVEIRAADLRFSLAEARELFAGAGVALSESALVVLWERTEGWAAGLRLAALSLVGHPDPERFAAGFSGTDRTVAEYLVAEVLDRQSEPVRRLLLRTSILDRVNGELADLLTGDTDGEGVLRDLERANAFVVSLDSARSWFRYHQMFAELLQLELRRTVPGEVVGLHRAASAWFVGNGYPVEAIRHAQALREWELAAELLADHWPGLHLDGQDATVHELLARFPPTVRRGDAQLAAISAADELAHGSLQVAERYLHVAEGGMASVPADQRGQARLLLGIARLLVARQLGDLPAAAEEAQRLQVAAETPETLVAAQPALSEDLRALALISLGTTEHWTARFAEAIQHLDQGRVLAQRIGRPYLEFTGLAYQSADEVFWSFGRSSEHSNQAIELAQRHGWTETPAAGIAWMALASVLTWQGRLAEAEPWIQRTERALRAEAEPTAGLAIYYVRGMLELGYGRDASGLAAFQAGERLAAPLAAPNLLMTAMRAFILQALVRLGETVRAAKTLTELDEEERDRGEIRISIAMLRLAQGDPHAASTALAPVLDQSAPLIWPAWLAQAFLLEAIARDTLGDQHAAGQALERALDYAEPDGALLWFLLHPVPELLDRHRRHRTSHAALLADIQSLLAGHRPEPASAEPHPVAEPLSDSELRVLRYLPTNLTAPEIASELSVSRNTVKTHMRNLYTKLSAHRRTDAVARARDLGLLAPRR